MYDGHTRYLPNRLSDANPSFDPQALFHQIRGNAGPGPGSARGLTDGRKKKGTRRAHLLCCEASKQASKTSKRARERARESVAKRTCLPLAAWKKRVSHFGSRRPAVFLWGGRSRAARWACCCEQQTCRVDVPPQDHSGPDISIPLRFTAMVGTVPPLPPPSSQKSSAGRTPFPNLGKFVTRGDRDCNLHCHEERPRRR